jgi:hypothetical protein
MRVVSRIEKLTDVFIEPVLIEDGAPLPEGCVYSIPPDGLYSPRWLSADEWAEGKPADTILAEAKVNKEAELRDRADSWYQGSVRSFEGAIVTAKYGRSGLTALNAEERAVFDEMNANYTRLKNLIGQVRAAATVSEVEAIFWT